ncbi:MAG TPA: serine/threonine-protein kinase PknK, partial [Cyanobacteria bacterium UBA8803]|nr:serine/threonine-protein kinase PknK [Cyanobacteria bacterium UBA9273]HBL57957.1 serine/threonine-protein kinase PknK [Cyanobacteria bacterium UBA8803]
MWQVRYNLHSLIVVERGNYALNLTISSSWYDCPSMLALPDYQTIAQIYESANSLVWRAIRTSDSQTVILKLLKQDYPTPEELVRYRQEYEITHHLPLEGVCRSLSLEQYQNTLFIVFEDFGGESLRTWMNSRQVNLEEFLQIAIATTVSLAEVHAANIIHKDLNPANIVYNPHTQQIKLIDFGIATVLSRENPTIRNPQGLEGTLAYISPEQTGRMNRSLDYRTDFYSLGVTYYELLTNKLPFDTTDALELLHCHIAKQPLPPIVVNPQIPQVISDIVMKLMAKIAEERYQSGLGIKGDLQKCLQELHHTGNISNFPLARQDISDKFQIPQKLYGREKEIDKLISAFERVSQRSEMMLFVGYSGIGKSALVQELYKPLTQKRGYFISGKFDQYQRNIPYSAIVSAFGELVKQLLAESEAQLKQWREKILEAVGINGQVIVEVIPEVKLIIGEPPEVPELGAAESLNRFNLVFENFIRVFTNPTHPLAIFFDDLQWTDSASLKLIQVLMSAAFPGLFLIGAYRDNEVSAAHPLMLTLEEIAKTGAIVERIYLPPLDLSTVTQLIVDTLNCSEKRAEPLAELVLAKTGGNPFFVNEFIKSLYTEGLLKFSSSQSLLAKGASQGSWQWDLEQIQGQGFTDNVVELMASKIQKLPGNTQEILKLAACIGNQFDIQTLALNCKKSLRQTTNDLQPALTSSLILPLSSREDDQLYLIAQELTNYQLPITHYPLPEYKFVHDRIQQAAYSLISEQHQPAIHWQIGQVLLQNTIDSRRDEQLFDIVNQLNLGSELISKQSERDELAQLNLQAGKKAKASTAYQSAFAYLQIGLELLGENSWHKQYDLTLALYVEAAEAAYLQGDFEQMERLAEVVQSQAKTVLDKVRMIEIKIIALIAQSKIHEAINTGLQILRELGVRLPTKPNRLHLLMGLLLIKIALAGKRISQLAALPEMANPYRLAALRILSNILPPAYFAAPKLMQLIVFQQVLLSVKYGISSDTIYAYASYGLVLCGVLGDIAAGYEFGQQALKVLERLNAKRFTAKAIFMVNGFSSHWQVHVKETLPAFLEAYKSGLATGDVEYAAYATYLYCCYSYLVGSELFELSVQMANYAQVMKQLNQEPALRFSQPYHQAVLNLLGMADKHCELVGNAYNEQMMMPLLIQTNDRTSIFTIYFNKLVLCYLFENYDEAALQALQAEQYLDSITAALNVPCFYLYDSLVQLYLARPFISYITTTNSRPKHHYLHKVINNQKKLKKWVHHAPMNHLHKFYLVEAERYRVIGQDILAIDCYDHAITLAKENEYINEAALAYELAAKFYLTKGKELSAKAYMLEARYYYQRWGATAKVKDLERRYPLLLAISSLEIKDIKTITTTRTSRSANLNLDIATVMKAAQAISGEIVLEKLLSSLMKILIENAGAQKGYLIGENLGKLVIEAVSQASPAVGINTRDEQQVTLLQSLPLENCQLLAKTIVNYVGRTQESVVLHDAVSTGQFSNDPYIKENHCQSILCFPLMNQGRLVSIIYLENNLISGAFTAERVELLKILSAQAAISIKNARFCQTLEDKVKERTAQLAEANQQLEQANRKIIALNENLQEENLRLSAELEVTKKLQQMILPKPEELEAVAGLEVAGFMEPADEVGGDYYDVIQQDGKVKISIGDVTGHGLESGVVMLMLQTAVRTLQESNQT